MLSPECLVSERVPDPILQALIVMLVTVTGMPSTEVASSGICFLAKLSILSGDLCAFHFQKQQEGD